MSTTKKPTARQLKRWSSYNSGHTVPYGKGTTYHRHLTVIEISEAQAKDDLCNAMDLIDKLTGLAQTGLDVAQRAVSKYNRK